MFSHAANLFQNNQKLLWGIITLAALSFFSTLTHPYNGEEAVYTITSLEMWYRKQWIISYLLGFEYGRPPLFNWLIIPIAKLLGWNHLLLASRLVTIAATFISSFVLFILMEKLFKLRLMSWLGVGCYLSGDLLVRRGWLAYADPLFACTIFIAVASLWLALEENRRRYFILAAVGVIASYLCKALTGYIFYGLSLLVFLVLHPNRRFLFSMSSITAHIACFIFLIVWLLFFSSEFLQAGMFLDISSKFTLQHLPNYLMKICLYPFDTVYRWLPVSGVLMYFWLKDKTAFQFFIQSIKENRTLYILFWLILLNYIPFWVAPVVRIRYLLPLYPFVAILFAFALYHLGQEKIRITLYWLLAGVVLKYCLAFFVFPYYENNIRGSYEKIAQDITNIVGEKPLYSNDYTALGLSVVAHLDLLRLPSSPITRSPKNWESGFVLEFKDQHPGATLYKTYNSSKNKLYLFCKGEACRP